MLNYFYLNEERKMFNPSETLNKALFYFSLIFIFSKLPAQNLVPNPSFEEYNYCPDFQGNLAYPTAICVPINTPCPKKWFDPNCGSSDYYNYCSINPIESGVPANAYGYQFPLTGNGYCGLSFCGSPCAGYGEYIAVKLTQPLEAAMEYCVSFWVSRADSFCLATNNFGINFYPDSTFTYDTKYYLDPSIVFTDIIYEEEEWVELKTSYIANGTENFIVIGNFDSTEVSSDTLCSNPLWNVWSYYYVDDVSIVPMEECDSTSNLYIPNVFTPNNDGINDYWIINSTSKLDITIYNRWGNIIFETISHNVSWDGKGNSSGVYFYIIRHNNKSYKGFIQLFR